MNRSLWRHLSRSGWLFIVLAVALGGVAWLSFDASRDSGALDVQETRASGRLLSARLAFEHSGLELLVDRLLVGIGEREPGSAQAADAQERLQRSHAEMKDIAAGQGPIAEVAAELVDAIDPDVVADLATDDRTGLYSAVDDVRWATESNPGTPPFDELFEIGFFAVLPSHVLVEALAAYAEVEDYPIDPTAAVLYDEVIDVVRSDGGWFGESPSTPLTDSEWFDVENARAAFPAVTADLDAVFAASDVIAVDTWMRELDGSSTPAPIPLAEMLAAVAQLQERTADLIDPLLDAETENANDRAESDADSRFTLALVALACSASGLVLLAIGLVRLVRHRRSLRRLSDLALSDAVTGVSSRYVLETSVRAALADGRFGHHVVIILDLDHFKMVNDAFGHAAGDAVLKEVGARLRSIAESTADSTTPAGRSHVVRMGGDEFLVALHSPTDVQIDRLTGELDGARLQPFDVSVEGRLESLRPEFSFGLVDVRGPGDLAELMAAADLAAYADKTKRSIERRVSRRGSSTSVSSDHAMSS